jgi:hypothetical protein
MATTLRGRPVDPYALPPEAGTRPNYGNERTSECLVDEDRPPTPDRYKKWRKSTYSVPGTRIIHPGGVDDWRDVKHPEFFGVRKKDPGEGEHVDDVLAQPGAESEYAQTKLTQAERHYHSTRMEPLGKCFSHGHVLPEECRTREHKFGKSTITPGGNDSKTLIYMPSAKPVPGERAQYIKSHGSYGPGEQRSRDYDWKGCDLKTHRFGEGVGSYVALNGLALGATGAMEQLDPQPIISQRMRNFKALQDKLGQSRYLGHNGAYQFGKMHRYGKKSVRGEGEWDARQCIAGDYAPEDCEPEPELGKTLTPGYRNILTEKSRGRTFGVPSVRTDIPKYAVRSVADSQNYGDDPTGKELLYPSALSQMGIDDDEFTNLRDKDDIFSLFRATGATLGDREHKLYDDISENGMCSIATFHKALVENLQ